MIELSLRFGKAGNVQTRRLNINFGWYGGDDFALFSLNLFVASEGLLEVFKLQIAKLSLSGYFS